MDCCAGVLGKTLAVSNKKAYLSGIKKLEKCIKTAENTLEKCM